MESSSLVQGMLLAIASAIAFGVSTPLIQRAGEDVGSFTTAALLYAGAALGTVGSARENESLPQSSWKTIAGMAIVGACLAPGLLAAGLARSSGVAASLLLNLEAVFTVLLGVLVYRESVGARVWLAVTVIAGGGALLALDKGGTLGMEGGLLLVVAATLGWAIDNTLSRGVADFAPERVVRAKGTLGAILSLGLAVARGEIMGDWRAWVGLLVVGAVGYGASLRLYLLAQRTLGSARTGSIFAIGPFVGALVAALFGESLGGWLSWLGGGLVGLGVYLHLTEAHDHEHDHPALEHDHPHRHDDGHHDHSHPGLDPTVIHTHPHAHLALTHRHAHGEDIHHRHH